MKLEEEVGEGHARQSFWFGMERAGSTCILYGSRPSAFFCSEFLLMFFTRNSACRNLMQKIKVFP